MDPKPSPSEFRLAPADSGSSAALRLPGGDDLRRTPYTDERLVEPETRQEIVRGQRMQAVPARAEHGDEHTEVTTVVRLHAAPGFTVSTDLLTRAGPHSDFATDTCVRRSGTDPETGARYLEELAFEVVNEQSMGHMVERAKELTACGVRRLIAVFVKKGEICEWSTEETRWIALDPDGSVEDPTLVRPFPLRALLDAAIADDSVVDALAAKNNPRLEQIKRQENEFGLKRGLVNAIEALCRVLEISLGADERALIEASDAAELKLLLGDIERERRWP